MQAATTDSGGQPQSVNQRLAAATAALAAAGVSTARLDAEVLLAEACGIDRTALFARGRDTVLPRSDERFRGMLERRLRREPAQYIVGRQEFWSLDFDVMPDVLIPRPETERLVELTLATVTPSFRGRQNAPNVCDLGTGSGCIAVVLARELRRARIWALDVSTHALHVAARNARRHGVAKRIRFVESDVFAAVRGRRFDAIVCNPPYVSTAELGAQPELAWEPRLALCGGVEGLDVIGAVLGAARDHLVEGGWLLMEIGAEQAPAVQELARAARLAAVEVYRDYAGLPRVLVARR